MSVKRDKALIKRFASYYKPHRRLFAIDMVCAFIIAGIDLAFPMLSKIGLSDYLPKLDFRGFFIIILIMLGMFILRGGFQYVLDYWGHILGVRMEYDMRKELFNHLQSLSFKFYDKTRTGHIMSRMVNDLNEMTELAHHGPEDIFLSVIMLTGSFGAMMYMNWKLKLAVYLFIPFLIIFTIKQMGKMSAVFKQVKV
jgi:ATP-binding cassette subfamily B protein